jgi:hypothetical protein
MAIKCGRIAGLAVNHKPSHRFQRLLAAAPKRFDKIAILHNLIVAFWPSNPNDGGIYGEGTRQRRQGKDHPAFEKGHKIREQAA